METDLVSSSKGKLIYFRMKELKDVLTKLGLPRQGKKQDLVERILDLLSDKAVAKIIDDTYRKMQMPEAADLATMGPSGFDICNMNLKMEVEDSLNSDVKICCPCGTSSPTESMVQCVDRRCLVRQHISCVIIPEKPMGGEITSLPPLFFCEMCRIKRADPFWETMAQLVTPMKLVDSYIPTDGTNPLQNAETTFEVTKVIRDLLQNTKYDVQAWCILLNDKVSFRMQWPKFAELHINGLIVKTTNRPGSQLLGANGRDDGALITLYIVEGVNKISLSGCDARDFCFGVRLVKRRTVEQVLNLIPNEKAGEPFEEALARVRRCIGGGIATGNEDSDSDLEIIADSITFNLRCPVSGSRIKVAGRFKPCVHMGCFDLEAFVELNQRARKWQCPICLKNYSLEDVIIDPFLYRVTAMMRNCGEDITDIEVKPDGSWRVKSKSVHNSLAQWHLPDGSTCVSDSDTSRPMKEENSSGNTIIARIKNNLSANIDVSKHQTITLSPKNHIEDNVETNGEKVVTMTSSASGNTRDDDPSINQECGGHIDLSAKSFNEINQIPRNFDCTCGVENQMSASARNTDIIVLSDSEEENDNAVPPTAYQSFFVANNTSAKISESYLQDAGLDASASSCFDLFSGSVDGVGISTWPCTSATGAGSGFPLFDGVSNVSDTFIDLEHGPASCSAPMNVFNSASKSTVASGGEVIDSSICLANVDIDDHLIDNTLAFVGEDPSLQNFLQRELPSLLSEPQLGQHPPTSHGIQPGNWISLRLGSNGVQGGVGSLSQSASTDGLEMRSSSISNEGYLSSEPKSNRTDDRKTSDGPFSFPRQPRSVRQRVHIS